MSYDPAVQLPAAKGAANGYAGLDAAGVVPHAQLPLFVGSGAGHQAGLAPDPGAGTTPRVLREDGLWVLPPGTFLESGTWTQASAGGTLSYEHGRLFELNGLLRITTAGTSGNVVLTLHWTDPVAAQSLVLVDRTITTVTTAGVSFAAVFLTAVEGLASFSYTVDYTGALGPLVLAASLRVTAV